RDAREMAKQVADLLRVPVSHVLVGSTGVIGNPLPMDKIRAAIPKLVKALSPQGGRAAAEAILTTDTRTKEAALRCEIGGRTGTLGGVPQGGGRIEPPTAAVVFFLSGHAARSRGAAGP